MPENELIHNVIAAVLWNSLLMILQGRQWPSIVPSRSGFISRQDFGDLAMDLSLDQAKPRKAARSLITFCQAGHYTRLHYKQDVFASGPAHRPVKGGLITEQTGLDLGDS